VVTYLRIDAFRISLKLHCEKRKENHFNLLHEKKHRIQRPSVEKHSFYVGIAMAFEDGKLTKMLFKEY